MTTANCIACGESAELSNWPTDAIRETRRELGFDELGRASSAVCPNCFDEWTESATEQNDPDGGGSTS